MNSNELKCNIKFFIKIQYCFGIINKNLTLGGCNSVGRVLDCGSKSHGFNTRCSPYENILYVKETKSIKWIPKY